MPQFSPYELSLVVNFFYWENLGNLCKPQRGNVSELTFLESSAVCIRPAYFASVPGTNIVFDSSGPAVSALAVSEHSELSALSTVQKHHY